MLTLKEYYATYMNPIFSRLVASSRLTALTNLATIITSDNITSLDLMYKAWSNNKYVSPLLDSLAEDETYTTTTRADALADILLLKYGNNWDRLIYTFNMTYNPINNYDMVEHEEVNSKITNTANTKRYGFNTAEDSPVGDTDGETETSGSKDDNYRDMTRSGNIGVTTSADLVKGELDLRTYSLIESIFKDIDKVLCLKVY